MGFLKDMLDGGASKAQKKNEAMYSKNMALLEQQYGYGLSKLLEGLQGIDAGFDAAQAEIDSVGDVATQQILDLHQQTLANTNQDLISMGLSNSTVAGNAATQVAQGTGQNLAGLAEQLAQMNAGLAVDEAKTKYGALDNISNFAMGKFNSATAITPQYEAAGGGLMGSLGEMIGSSLGSIPGAITSMFGGGGMSPQTFSAASNAGYTKPKYTPGSLPSKF